MDETKKWFLEYLDRLVLNGNITREEKEDYILAYDYAEKHPYDERRDIETFINYPESYYANNRLYSIAAENAASGKPLTRRDFIYLYSRQIYEAAKQKHFLAFPKVLEVFDSPNQKSKYAFAQTISRTNRPWNEELTEKIGFSGSNELNYERGDIGRIQPKVQNMIANMSRFVPTEDAIKAFSLEYENSIANKPEAQTLFMDNPPIDYRLKTKLYEITERIDNMRVVRNALGPTKTFRLGIDAELASARIQDMVMSMHRAASDKLMNEYVIGYKTRVGDVNLRANVTDGERAKKIQSAFGVANDMNYYEPLKAYIQELQTKGIYDPKEIKRRVNEKVGFELTDDELDIISSEYYNKFSKLFTEIPERFDDINIYKHPPKPIESKMDLSKYINRTEGNENLLDILRK